MKKKISFFIILFAGLLIAADSPYARRIRPFVGGFPSSCIENEVGYDMTGHTFGICTNLGYQTIPTGSSGITNSAGANVFPLSDGTNLITSVLSQSGTTTKTVNVAGNFAPTTTGVRNLGSTTLSFANLYLGNATARTQINGNLITVDRTLSAPDETGTICTTGSICSGYQASGTYATSANNLSFFASTTSAQLRTLLSDENGTGVALFDSSTSATFITPILGTPTSVNLTNGTNLPVTGLSGLGTNVATFLATPSSANLASAVTNETGSGVLVFGTAPTFTTTTTLTNNSLGTSSTDGIIVQNTTTGSSQYSPRLRLSGRTVNDTAMDWIMENQSNGGASTDIAFSAQENAGGYSKIFSIRYNGLVGNPSFLFNAPAAHNPNFQFQVGGANVWYMRPLGTSANEFSLLNSDTNGNIEILNITNTTGTSTIAKWASSHIFATDNAYDIGASSATRPRTGYFGTSVVSPYVQQTATRCFLAADQTTTSTTFANITGCSITVTSGRKYTIRAVLYLSDSTAADGAKIDFNGGSATATNFRVHCTAFDTALNLSSQGTALSTAYAASTFTGNGMFECYGTFEPSSTSTFIPRVAQNAHTVGTLTLARGSHLLLEDMP